MKYAVTEPWVGGSRFEYDSQEYAETAIYLLQMVSGVEVFIEYVEEEHDAEQGTAESGIVDGVADAGGNVSEAENSVVDSPSGVRPKATVQRNSPKPRQGSTPRKK